MQNVEIERQRYVAKLGDFGGVCKVGQKARLATPCRSSPEACQGNELLTAKTDVFSCGVILWVMCGGEDADQYMESSGLR